MKTIKTKSSVRAYDGDQVFFDLEYYVDDTEAPVFIATVKITVPIDGSRSITLAEAYAQGAERVRQILQELASQ